MRMFYGLEAKLSFTRKLAALISIMPKPVLGGATIVMFAMVAVAGLRIVVSDGLTPRNQFILAIALALGLGVTMTPEAVAEIANIETPNRIVQMMLPAVAVVLQSGLAVGAIVATTLNAILPKEVQ